MRLVDAFKLSQRAGYLTVTHATPVVSGDNLVA